MYAVSFQMLASDRVARWLVEPDDLLSDSRTLHYWDDRRVVGRYFDEHVTKLGEPGDGRVEWDAYFLYGRDSLWYDAPPDHVSWGRTIVDSRDRLLEDFGALLESSTDAPQ